MLQELSAEGPVLFFDGVCNLCNWSVQFVIEHEKDPILRFASLQSNLGRKVKSMASFADPKLDSLILLKDGHLLTESKAAITLAGYLRWPYYGLSLFHVIPQWLLDPIYRFVAYHRYRIFGKQEQCMIPDQSTRFRFVDH